MIKIKSYNHLYEQLISHDNVIQAIVNSSKGKRKRPEVAKEFANKENYVSFYQYLLANLPVYHHDPIQIYDGISRKQRQIIVPMYKEQVVHHCIVNVLKPIIFKGLYTYSCGSIPGRGVHSARIYLEKKIRSDKYNTKYCLKMDVRKFFDSVDHDVLKHKLQEIIHDEKFLHVLNQVIDVTPSGLPLGYYTSQWLANFFLSDLDHYIKEQLHAKYYVRYMDDMVIFGHDKTELHEMRKAIDNYLHDLHLQMKDNWQVFLFDDGEGHGRCLDFMGFKFYRNRVILRKSIMLKACRKAKRMGKKFYPTIYDCRQMLSYIGWFDWTDTYNMYCDHIKPYVDMNKCKHKISDYERMVV